ncbi:MAG: SWF/SNF helicase family protein, partial [Gammaproteobacteria bacterium]|nr:SWF/SNF helicase family protein [Gammaproteobacteria bacterium]
MLIYEFLKQEIENQPALCPFKNRIEVVSGSNELGEVSRPKAILGFAPRSMGAPSGQDDDLYDLLIATDVLAEGVNLQQCRNIVNFDMPWNPMRLVQRHGRIDRIG